MLTCTLAMAQRDVSGRVVTEAGEPLSSASILIKGQRTGVTADKDGLFTLKAKIGDILVVSNQGKSKEVTVVDDQIGDIKLPVKVNNYTEIIVTGLGQSKKSDAVGFATAKVKAAELTQAKVVNLQNGLTGKVSGLNVQSVNSGVFGDTRITLRGIRSLTGNNQPMLILDGVPISLSYISTINPNDVLDVNILKSSSSTAIYGPDGVNGAIIVTTRRGVKGKPSVTVSQTTQFEKVSFMPQLQNQFGSGSSIDALGYGVYDPIENQTYGDAFDGSLRDLGREDENGKIQKVVYSAKSGEKLKFWNTGITNQTDVSYGAGDFYLSAQNVSIKGIQPKDENNRITLNLKATKEYNKFKAGFGVTYGQQKYNVNAGSLFGGRDYTPYWNVINTPPQVELTKYKNWKSDYFSTPNGYFNDYYHNPYWVIDNFRNIGRSDDILGNVQLDYKINSMINITYRLGYTLSSNASKATQGAYEYSGFAKKNKYLAATGSLQGGVLDQSSFSDRLNSEIFATFKKQVNKVSIDALVGQSFREINSKSISASSTNLGIPGVYNLASRKGEPNVSEGISQTRLERYFGKVSLGYNNWLYGEITGSYDFDSRLSNPYTFTKKKDIGFFYPGASASIVLSEAIPSLKDNKYISFLKLRGAVSKTGNVNLGAYALENTFNPSGNFPYGTLLGFTASNTIRLPKYDPEFVKNTEVGFELGLKQNKINLEATAYKSTNSNQILNVQLSNATGYSGTVLNAAEFENRGFELDLKLTPIIKMNNGLSIDLKINYAYQTSEVKKILDGLDELGIGNGNFVVKGSPAFVFKLSDYLRDDQGRIIVDKNTGLPSQNPSTKQFGRTTPSDILGLNLNLNFKNFTLSAVGEYRGGSQIFSGIGGDLDFAGLSTRSAANNRQPFVLPNSSYFDGTKYVANTDVYIRNLYNFWSTAVNTGVNTNYLSSGAFWKIREMALAYNFPDKIFSGKAVKGVSLSVSGRNLYTWLPRSNQWTDPEFSNGTGNAQGLNNVGNIPPTRTMGLNVVFKF
jgi:TonB-linked SusC/RagA family outer membrane protein